MKNYRRIQLYLLVLFVLAVISSPAKATPAYFGYTGLMLTPTADTLKTSGFDFGGVFLSNDNNDTTFLSANIGLLDSLEVGAAMINPERGDSEGILNAKFKIMKENLVTPAVAIGISDLTDRLDSTPYVVMSKSLPLKNLSQWTPRFHVGVGGGHLDGVFAGLSAKVSDRMQLMAEYDTNDINFGLQFAAAQSLRLHAGLVRGDDFGFGLSYNAGF